MLGYALLIALGALLLGLPLASASDGLSWIDALFTAASAVCVTGLTVVDTPQTFSVFGKAVILFLIQVGGIGIMVLSTIFLLFLGKRIGMTGKLLIRDTYSFSRGKGVLGLVGRIAAFTAVIEIAGAVVLFFRFSGQYPLHQAIGYSVFHSVSAFCNAGFSLFSDSFEGFRRDWLVNLDICVLIVLGGIGFVVMDEVLHRFTFSRRCWSCFSLHAKLVLVTTGLLLSAGTGVVFYLEMNNTLADLAFPHQVLAAFFQAVNARTAGFNTVDISALTNGTLFITAILMFIGTAPGSCGGGVKVTSLASLAILGVSRFLGEEHPHVFFRRISDESMNRALSLMMISMVIIILGVLLLQQVEIGRVPHFAARGQFLEILFEIVSAFGTVGLSTGLTPTLSTSGKWIVIVMMFIGRLGPLVVGIALTRQGPARRYAYAEENIMIG